MDYKIPKPIGDLDWGNLVSDILARSDDLDSLKKEINKAIREKPHLAYLWYRKYKDSPKDYLLDHDVDVDFYKSLFGDPTSNQPFELYLEHLFRHTSLGCEIPKYEPPQAPNFSDSWESPFEEVDGRLYIHLKVDPPFPLISPLNDLGLPDKELYTTGDICSLLDMHPDTFRYKLRSGIYPEPKQRAGESGGSRLKRSKRLCGLYHLHDIFRRPYSDIGSFFFTSASRQF